MRRGLVPADVLTWQQGCRLHALSNACFVVQSWCWRSEGSVPARAGSARCRQQAGQLWLVGHVTLCTHRTSLQERGITLFTCHVRRGAPDVQDPGWNSHSKLNCIAACIQVAEAGGIEGVPPWGGVAPFPGGGMLWGGVHGLMLAGGTTASERAAALAGQLGVAQNGAAAAACAPHSCPGKAVLFSAGQQGRRRRGADAGSARLCGHLQLHQLLCGPQGRGGPTRAAPAAAQVA